jgi:sulfite reductase alpha subunit-like flavoprotein
VSGRAKNMPKSVEKAFAEIIDSDNGVDYVEKMKQ